MHLRTRPGRKTAPAVVSYRGFTLVELMIVVAIIGLLAAIAIPNFLKFQCRAKQGEVKAGLGALFVSERSFFGEHSTYGTDLISLGWEPSGAPLYLYGFSLSFPASVDGIPNYNGALNVTTLDSVVGSPARYRTDRTIKLSGSPITTADLPVTICTGQAFIVGAAGDINPDGALAMDIWAMDTKRQLLAVSNDCLAGF